MGLRLSEGIDLTACAASPALSPSAAPSNDWSALGLLERPERDRLRATAAGRPVSTPSSSSWRSVACNAAQLLLGS